MTDGYHGGACDVVRLVVGYDPLEAIGYHVFCSSVIRRSSLPLQITPLHLPNLADYDETHADGSNDFVYSRFLVPHLMGYEGFAIFADGADMLCRSDIADLWRMRDSLKAVQVVQHEYTTTSRRKYVGTSMEAPNASYPRKNWSSLMLINCAHYGWRSMGPGRLSAMTGTDLHRFSFLDERSIGELPATWNWLVREYPYEDGAQIAHFTLGIPAFAHYSADEYASEWWDEWHEVKGHADYRRVPRAAAATA